MTKKKPDRWERLVLAEMKKNDTPSSTCIWLNGPDVVELLRKQHKAVVEMVREELEQCRTFRKTAGSDSTRTAWACRMDGCYEILDLLKKRAI